MNRPRPLAFLIIAISLAAGAARADESVTVNYHALDRLPPKRAASGVAVPRLIPPGLISHRRQMRPYRSDALANAPSGLEATPPDTAKPDETLSNPAEIGGGEHGLAQGFGRSFVRPKTSSGISAATPNPRLGPSSIDLANAAADSEPVFVSWTQARTIGEVYFQTNGVELSDIEGGSIDALNELASRIGASQTRVLLRAFGGEAGDQSREAHRAALRRGLAVRKYLMARGVPSICIDVTAMGGATDGGSPDRVDVLAGAS
jgi:outer membrane protein OmpA-like peptidoglycan-associated protein